LADLRGVLQWRAKPSYFREKKLRGRSALAEERDCKGKDSGEVEAAGKFVSQQVSAGARRDKLSQKQMNEICGGTRGMGAAAQIPQAVQPLDGQRQASERPSDQQAVGVMMANMFEVVAIFGITKPLIFDLPPALGSVIQNSTADCCDRGIG
jgi:hypothetical protein